MVFSTSIFIYLFLPITLLIYYIAPKKSKNFIILLSGLVFYSWGEPIYVVVMLISTMIDYFAGLVMNHFEGKKLPRKICLIVSVVMNLGLLGVFKYSGFIAENINAIAGSQIIDINNMNFFGIDFLPMNMLPIGISFFTFQSMSYTIDLYMGNVKVQKNPISFAAFVTLFPQIVAGPIVRYIDVAEQLKKRNESIEHFAQGVWRFSIGLGKKVILANTIGELFDTISNSAQSELSVVASWLGIIAYTFQIYFDFSGYSDMAIGLGKIFGFTYCENFNYPYISKSATEFWRRWHMSLGSFFRDYVYIPLGGNRKRQLLNIFVVWFLTGFWHGASWNFIIWGLYFGTIIYLEKKVFFKFTKKLPQVIQWFFAMIVIMVGWAIFYYVDLNSLGTFLKALVGLNNNPLYSDTLPITFMSNVTFVVLCIIASTPVPKMLFQKLNDNKVVNGNLDFVQIIFNVSLIFCIISMLVGESYNPFLYYRF